jgi:glycosyl hydrolase family 131
MKDAQRPLNLSHEYQLAFLESNDFSTNQFVLKTGTILGGATANPDTLQLFGNVNDGNLLFSVPFRAGVFHNFAVLLDFNAL